MYPRWLSTSSKSKLDESRIDRPSPGTSEVSFKQRIQGRVECTLNRVNDIPQESVEYRGVRIFSAYPHLDKKTLLLVDAPKFQYWIDQFNFNEIDLDEFHVTDIDFFGPEVPNKLGFVKGYGVARDKATGDLLPAIAFIRGNSVAVLIVVRVRETGLKYVLLCKQLRFPAGRLLIEACAGMIDDETTNVVGVVFNEVRQETGFLLKQENLIPLGAMRPSPGGCDEVINLYAWETEISQSEYDEKLNNIFGEGAYEKIKLVFYDFDTFDNVLDEIGDAKAECCWRRYCRSNLRKLR